jgi:Plasmid pRiA4b ORF-3-like protein
MVELDTLSLVHGQQFNSFHRRTRSKKLCDFRLHQQEKFLYSLGSMDQWEWEMRVLDLQNGTDGDEKPVCLDGRGATPPQYCGGATGYRLMLKRQEMRAKMCPPAERETMIGIMADAYPDQPVSNWEVLRNALAEGCQSLDRRLERLGPLEPDRFSLREANQRLEKFLEKRRLA